MATGDQNDMVGRLKAALPPTWFPNTPAAATSSNSPVLDGLLAGVATTWVWVFSLLQFVKSQTRIATASGVFLDIIASDFFGSFLYRRIAELDGSLRSRIQKNLFRPKITRAALIEVLTDLTGNVPVIFEPAYPLDTGAYGHVGMTVGTNLGYGLAGGYGSLLLPFQFFVDVTMPIGSGIADVAGYGTLGGFVGMPGGYGVGSFEYASLDMVIIPVSTQEVLAAINDARPVATTAWTSIRT